MKTHLQKEIVKVFEQFPEYWNGETLLKNKAIEDIRNYEPKLLAALLENKTIKETYSVEINNNYIFKNEEFISMLRYKNYLENSYTRYSNEIGLTTEGKYLNYSTDVVLGFPHKDGILEGGMTKEDSQGNNEIFYHNVLAREEIDTLLSPKILTNVRKYTKDGSHKINKFHDNDNLIIKGNNLIALKSLSKRYTKKVQTIYLDPPYLFDKTQKDDDFLYNSNFKTSTWLTFMKNRLEVALDLLKPGGYIVVQMNDTGVFHLKVLMDEIFKNTEGGFINHVSVKMSDLSGPKMAHTNKKIPKIKEHILIYTNDYQKNYFNPVRIESTWDEAIDDKRYTSFVEKNNSEDIDDWEYTTVRKKLNEMGLEYGDKEAYEFLIKNADSVFRTAANSGLEKISKAEKFDRDKFTSVTTGTGLNKFVYKDEEVIFATSKLTEIKGELVSSEAVSDMWLDIALNDLSNEGGVKLKNGKKPEALLARIIELTTQERDIVLDFFMGSATTQAVAMKMNRQFIGIEQMDYIENVSIKRLQNVIDGEQRGISKDRNWEGGGTYVYAELYKLKQIYIDQIQDANNQENIEEVLEKIRKSDFLNLKVNLEKIFKENEVFYDLTLEEQKSILIQVLDNNQLYLSYSEIDDDQYAIDDETKAFNASFYDEEI